MNDLFVVKLGDCISKVIDYRGKTPKKLGGDWTESGYRVISALNVHNGFIDNINQIRYVNETLYNKWMQEEIKRNDILLSSEGASLGENTIWDSDEKIVLGQRLYAIRTDKNKLDPWYLAGYMQTNKFRKQVDQISTGSTVFGISQPLLMEIQLIIPDINIQRKIGKIYQLIRSKVIINNETIYQLESFINTVHNFWFLQFEFPNEEGKPYRSSGGKMVWNEELKREIPEGWGVFDFTDTEICQMIQPGVELFNLKNYLATSNVNDEYINDGNWIKYNNRETRANMQPVKYSVWFAKMKNSIKHISIPSNSDWFTQKYILSTGFVGLRCNEFSFAYVHSIVNSNYFEKRKNILAHGATQEAVNNEDLKNIKFVLPNKTILNTFALNINPFLELKFNKIRENQELISLRDFLLPLLMNGQITFKGLDS